MTFVMGGVPHECLTLAPGSDRIPVELLQILTQYAICRLPASTFLVFQCDFGKEETQVQMFLVYHLYFFHNSFSKVTLKKTLTTCDEALLLT